MLVASWAFGPTLWFYQVELYCICCFIILDIGLEEGEKEEEEKKEEEEEEEGEEEEEERGSTTRH